MNNFGYEQQQQYMVKSPYDMIYPPPQNMMDNLKNQGFPIENPQLYYRMNSKIFINK